jgi:predicted DNA-binding transcriptional regulator AlpA
MHAYSNLKLLAGSAAAASSVSKRHGREMKDRQNSKIREIREALRAAGFLALDSQARALGLSRSTTWSILQCQHKSSGLSATVIDRMLGARQLPPPVRIKILEYLQEKTAGLYGHTNSQLRRFKARLSINGSTSVASQGIGQQRRKARDP